MDDAPKDREEHPALVEALRDPACYPHPTDQIEIVETHISWIVLTGQYVYKIKKPVKLPFLDFSTLSSRQHYCAEELALNKRLATSLYVDVVTIGGSIDAPRIGETPLIEVAVRMRQFDQSQRLDNQLRLNRNLQAEIRRFAVELSQFHMSQAVCADDLPDLERERKNLEQLRRAAKNLIAADKLKTLEDWTRRNTEALVEKLAERARQGHFRDCHGDLHLENVVCLDDKLVAFDALEFDRQLRVIDTVDEVAFFAMDLEAHGHRELEACFLSAYFEDSGDYGGLELLTYYQVYRALVRAKVAAYKVTQSLPTASTDDLEKYVDAASSLSERRLGTVLLTHGYSGSGKTYWSDRLIAPLEAIRIRSDIERKRLASVAPLGSSESPVGGGIYAATMSERTYRTLTEAARVVIEQGFNCILDGTFLRKADRDIVRRLCHDAGAKLTIVDCHASVEVLEDRIAQRVEEGRDASEARRDVLAWQLRNADPLAPEELAVTHRLDTERPVDIDTLASNVLDRARVPGRP